NDTHENDAAPHLWRENAFTDRAWRLLHQPFVRRVDAKRKRGQPVGDQIDPEDLRGEERQNEPAALGMQTNTLSQHNTEEHRQYFPDVRRQQVPQELTDVREYRAALFRRGDDRGEVV